MCIAAYVSSNLNISTELMSSQIFSFIAKLFYFLNSKNFDRLITSVGLVVPEIFPESGGDFQSWGQYKNKMESLILYFGLAY